MHRGFSRLLWPLSLLCVCRGREQMPKLPLEAMRGRPLAHRKRRLQTIASSSLGRAMLDTGRARKDVCSLFSPVTFLPSAVLVTAT